MKLARPWTKDYDGLMQGDFLALPDAEAFGEPMPQAALTEEEPVQTADAPLQLRQGRSKKLLGLDAVTELHNHDLATWNAKYAETMALISRERMSKRAARQAKKNAEFWVFGGQLGGLNSLTLALPLREYYQATMIELSRQGAGAASSSGEKRKRESDGEGEGRSVRTRGDHDGIQLGSGVEFIAGEDADVRMFGDDEVSCAHVRSLARRGTHNDTGA